MIDSSTDSNDSITNATNDKHYLHRNKSIEDKRNANKMEDFFSSSDKDE